MRLRLAAVLASIVLLFPSPAARADDVFLLVDDPGEDGLVVAHVDLDKKRVQATSFKKVA